MQVNGYDSLPDAPTPAFALSAALADDTPDAASDGGQSASEAPVVVPMTTMFPHSTTWPIWISGQANFIFQTHPNFHSPYEGINSFTAPFEYKVSMLGTLYTGLQVPGTHKLLEVLFDEESAGGRGLSNALGNRRIYQSGRGAQPKPELGSVCRPVGRYPDDSAEQRDRGAAARALSLWQRRGRCGGWSFTSAR